MCCSHGFKAELHDILTSKKWWANWIAFILAIAAGILSLYYDDNVIQLNKWTTDPRDVYNNNNIIGIGALFFIIFGTIMLCEIVTNLHDKEKQLNQHNLWHQIKNHFIGYTVFYILVLISFFVDAQQTLHSIGIGYSIISIILGMALTNICFYCNITIWSKLTKTATKNCEFYIKIGLVLLATDLQIIFATGAPGLIISWLLPPFILIFMFYLGTRVLNISNYSFVIALSSGTAICGVSAIAAVASVVELTEQDSAIAMGILTFFTMLYMVLCPYLCLIFDIDSIICGAWIGGSVDETGKVVASVAILDNDDAYEAAVLIKMSQNILIGFVCLVLAMVWNDLKDNEIERCTKRQHKIALLEDKDGSSFGSIEQGGASLPLSTPEDLSVELYNSPDALSGSPVAVRLSRVTSRGSHIESVEDDIIKVKVESDDMNKCEFLWRKFPKFILGYLILSVVISLFINPYSSDQYTRNFQENIKRLSIWLFTLGFVGIGANTKFDILWQSIKDGKYLSLYLIGQTFDTIATLVVAWLVFEYIV